MEDVKEGPCTHVSHLFICSSVVFTFFWLVGWLVPSPSLMVGKGDCDLVGVDRCLLMQTVLLFSIPFSHLPMGSPCGGGCKTDKRG